MRLNEEKRRGVGGGVAAAQMKKRISLYSFRLAVSIPNGHSFCKI